MTTPLLLAAHELARGSVPSLPDNVDIVASDFSSSYLAMLFQSRTEQDCVRLGVFKTSNSVNVEEPKLHNLLFEVGDRGPYKAIGDKWSLVWSPDMKYLIVNGQVSCSENAFESVFWIFAHREWLVSTALSQELTTSSLVFCVRPSQYLSAKHWQCTTGSIHAFFPTKSGSKVFVLSEDGIWLSVSVQMSKLTLAAMNQLILEDTAGIVTMKVVKKLTEWHAGITAVCYDSKSSILVVSGGVKDSSLDLLEKNASSLSVWKVANDKDSKEPGDLLDCTIILKGITKPLRKNTNEERTEQSSHSATTTYDKSSKLLSSIKRMLYVPLKMTLGSDTLETRVARGYIRHLALAPNSNFVSMVDDLGRIAIRQIDVCADILKWQDVHDVAVACTHDVVIKTVVWLANDIVAMMLSNNSIIYSRFLADLEDEILSRPATSDSESDSIVGPVGRLVLIPAKCIRPALGVSTSSVQIFAYAVDENALRDNQSVAFTAYELVIAENVWAATQVHKLELQSYVELLMEEQKYGDALEAITLYGSGNDAINADTVHRRIWMHYRNKVARFDERCNDKLASADFALQHCVLLCTQPSGLLQREERDEFLDALGHLRAMSDKRWVLNECLHIVADDSSANMKMVLEIAHDALVCLNNGNEFSTEFLQAKEDLQRYLYRLETLRMILCEENEMSTMSIVGGHLFDGATYASFRSSSVVTTAKQLAREGRVDAIKIVLKRHGWNVLPYWLEILELLPPSVPPSTYARLLPAIVAEEDGDGKIYTLSRSNDLNPGCDDNKDLADQVALLDENRLYDVTDEELWRFEEYMSIEREERNSAYGKWLVRRILELDTCYGQLAFAYEMSRLATKCISGWSTSDAKKPVEQLFQHSERLYKCVYLLQLSACCMFPLEKWSKLSTRDQAMIVVSTDENKIAGNVASIIDRLDEVFVAQRGDRTYVLDDLFSWLAQTASAKASLSSLTLAAQLLQRSNPSIDLTKRLIQSDPLVVKTALNIVYSVETSDIIGDKPLSGDVNVYMQHHLALVEQLWAIFQSLPARKENESPEMAQLQVAVDEMEDLLISMDVLSKYGLGVSPSELRILVNSDSAADDGSTVNPLGLLEQMCSFVFCGKSTDDDKHFFGGNQWLDVLQDAVKLREHVFGEQLSQPMILDVLLKQLLARDCAYVDAAQDLVNHWIAFDVQAVEHVLDILFMAIRAKLDFVTGYSEHIRANAVYKAALSCMDIVKQLLSLPLWNEGDRAASNAKAHYEEVFSLELDTVHACELLDLLTYGKIRMSPPQLRTSEGQENIVNFRLDAVCQIFTINPSNCKPSTCAKEWLTQHAVGKIGLLKGEMTTDVWNEPLAAVMELARLLRVDSQKLKIWMKGAYAALYCMEYDVAYDLTIQVIEAFSAEADRDADFSVSSDTLTLSHLISLVLDLVSASSFRSWEKKRKLCCALISAANIPSTDLFAHQATDLVLSWLKKIEVVQALMVELGLSDDNLALRRPAGCKSTISAESVLLCDLKVVVDSLYEERCRYRRYLLRLLQLGVQLLFVTSSVESYDDTESLSTFLKQLVQLCVEEATELEATYTASDSRDYWRQYMELGFSYLVTLGDLSNFDNNFEAFCIDEALSQVCTDPPRYDPSVIVPSEIVQTTEGVVRSFHHFFLLQACQAKERMASSDGLFRCKEYFDTLSSLYETAQRMVRTDYCVDDLDKSTLSAAAATAKQPNEMLLLVPGRRYEVFMSLAQRCQEWLVLQKKSEELEQVSMLFSSNLDLDRFLQDEGYRNKKILLLATKKEHFQLSRQLARKYGIDEYECVLAYIRNALRCSPDRSQAGRREQLDEAFAMEQVNILEEAMQRPISFGDFLLKSSTTGAPSLYEAIDGTDHVGVLLMLRMILECSKRVSHEFAESVSPHVQQSLFPLSKASTDRITLLFMCLRKLKDIADSLNEVGSVNLKLISVATTTTELLTSLASTHPDVIANRQVAVEAARPLLTGKTIKLVTKILRKLHHVAPSSIVMIYINDTLTNIWRKHGASAISADLASFAYESCVPCLSVLSSKHLLLFQYLFLNGLKTESSPEFVAHIDLAEEFYGQQLSSLQRFGSLLTLQKRVEIVADTLTMFQSKYNSWQHSGPRSNESSASSTTSSMSVSVNSTRCDRVDQELQYLERELAKNMCYLLLHEIEQNKSTFDKSNIKASSIQSLEPVAVVLNAWFAMDSLQQAFNESFLHSTVLMELCHCVTYVALATLIMELVLSASKNKFSHDIVADAIAHCYKTTVINLVNRCMGSEEKEANQSVDWVERLAWTWVTGVSAPRNNQIAELENYLCVTLGISRDEKAAEAHAIYNRFIMQLTQSPSKLLKEIGSSQNNELQTSAENNAPRKDLVALVREAVLSQWEQVILFKEKQQKWTEAAVLSHMLISCDATRYIHADHAAWDFGLHVKAIWSTVLTKHKMDESRKLQRIFKLSSRDIINHFVTVFEELLAFIETCSCENNPNALRFAKMATLALSNLLIRHKDVRRGNPATLEQQGTSAWHQEQFFAVQTRAHAQFQVGTAIKRPALLQKEMEAGSCWTALFARGVWGVQVLNWYTLYAFAELSSEKEATEAVILAHWKANDIDVAIQLLLICPIDDLRKKYTARLLQAIRQLPQDSRSWSAAIELALLRFDVAVLLQHGLHASVMAFLLQESNRNSALWTSSGAYVVCALVTKGEFAAAGRLTCALHCTHPLLWDIENARLLLANYLRSLASSTVQQRLNINSIDVSHLQHEVYVQISSRFANAFQ